MLDHVVIDADHQDVIGESHRSSFGVPGLVRDPARLGVDLTVAVRADTPRADGASGSGCEIELIA
jgi:hypothetical protein